MSISATDRCAHPIDLRTDPDEPMSGFTPNKTKG